MCPLILRAAGGISSKQGHFWVVAWPLSPTAMTIEVSKLLQQTHISPLCALGGEKQTSGQTWEMVVAAVDLDSEVWAPCSCPWGAGYPASGRLACFENQGGGEGCGSSCPCAGSGILWVSRLEWGWPGSRRSSGLLGSWYYENCTAKSCKLAR